MGIHGFTLSLWAKRFNARYGRRDLPATLFLTDLQRIADIEHAIYQLPKPSLVIIRDYDIPGRTAYVKRIILLSRKLGHKVLVGQDEVLAMRFHADGVHFPEYLWRKAIYCKRTHPHWMISTSVHSLHSLLRLQAQVDFVLFSPIFLTASHPGIKTTGTKRLASLCRISSLPIYPLGGIYYATISRLKNIPIPGIAAIGGYKV